MAAYNAPPEARGTIPRRRLGPIRTTIPITPPPQPLSLREATPPLPRSLCRRGSFLGGVRPPPGRGQWRNYRGPGSAGRIELGLAAGEPDRSVAGTLPAGIGGLSAAPLCSIIGKTFEIMKELPKDLTKTERVFKIDNGGSRWQTVSGPVRFVARRWCRRS